MKKSKKHLSKKGTKKPLRKIQKGGLVDFNKECTKDTDCMNNLLCIKQLNDNKKKCLPPPPPPLNFLQKASKKARQAAEHVKDTFTNVDYFKEFNNVIFRNNNYR